jgi:hypothetical protein
METQTGVSRIGANRFFAPENGQDTISSTPAKPKRFPVVTREGCRKSGDDVGRAVDAVWGNQGPGHVSI